MAVAQRGAWPYTASEGHAEGERGAVRARPVCSSFPQTPNQLTCIATTPPKPPKPPRPFAPRPLHGEGHDEGERAGAHARWQAEGDARGGGLHPVRLTLAVRWQEEERVRRLGGRCVSGMCLWGVAIFAAVIA